MSSDPSGGAVLRWRSRDVAAARIFPLRRDACGYNPLGTKNLVQHDFCCVPRVDPAHVFAGESPCGPGLLSRGPLSVVRYRWDAQRRQGSPKFYRKRVMEAGARVYSLTGSTCAVNTLQRAHQYPSGAGSQLPLLHHRSKHREGVFVCVCVCVCVCMCYYVYIYIIVCVCV